MHLPSSRGGRKRASKKLLMHRFATVSRAACRRFLDNEGNHPRSPRLATAGLLAALLAFQPAWPKAARFSPSSSLYYYFFSSPPLHAVALCLPPRVGRTHAPAALLSCFLSFHPQRCAQQALGTPEKAPARERRSACRREGRGRVTVIGSAAAANGVPRCSGVGQGGTGKASGRQAQAARVG